MKNRLLLVMLGAATGFAAAGRCADVPTNVWVGASGGAFETASNWSNPSLVTDGAAFVSLRVAAGLARADEIVVGTGETFAFTNTTDVTQSDAVRVSDRAVIEQRGTGTTTLKSGTFTENKPVSINVRAGTVKLETSEQTLKEYAKPETILNKAAFWVDATVAASLQKRGDSSDEVAAWLDVRETGAGTETSPYLYTRAVAFTNDYLTAFPLQTNLLSKTGVGFRGLGSGCFMNWVKPDGTQQKVENIRHAFIVHGATGRGKVGTFLGQRSSKSTDATLFNHYGSTYLWNPDGTSATAIHSARTYLNGAEVDAFRTKYDETNAIYEVEVETLAGGGSLAAMCFFNDRDFQVTATDGTVRTNDTKLINSILGTVAQNNGGDRAGGDVLFEVLVFTNDLTAAERLAVSDWLNQKWRGITPPTSDPALTLALATNTVVEVNAAESSGVYATVAGDGLLRKMGAGALTLGATSAASNSSMRLDIAAGKVTLNEAIPLVVAAGGTITAEKKDSGTEISAPTTGTDAKALVKDGTGSVTLDAIPEGVKQITVNGGELRLSDPRAATRGLLAPADEIVEAAIPDSGFESFPASDHVTVYSDISNGSEKFGWHAVMPSGDEESRVFFYDQKKDAENDWAFNTNQWSLVRQDSPSGVLVVKKNASAWCEVEIPRDGDYVLTFRAAPRWNKCGEQLDVMIGDSQDSLELFGAFSVAKDVTTWQTFTFAKKHLKAGTKQFWLKSKENGNDFCTQFDDFALTRVAESGEWALPNGGFEIHATSFDATKFCKENAACVTGCTLTQSTDGKSEEKFLTTFSAKGVANNHRFNLAWNRKGDTQLYMSGEGPTLTTTFTPPAGTWRFRADFSTWSTDWQSANFGYMVAAKLTVGEDASKKEIDLGSVTTDSHALLPRTWPNAFTTDGATSVTLTLTGSPNTTGDSAFYAHGILDNLTLVPDANVETSGSIVLPRSLEFTLAEGAKLALDFAGTNTVSGLRIGGKSYSGIVSFATRPDLSGTLSGSGTLNVMPKGLMLIVR
jgi:hypothetical protein